MQDDVADIGFSTVFATLRGSIRETHLHVSSLVPWSTRRRGYRHTKDAAMANPAARAIFLLIGCEFCKSRSLLEGVGESYSKPPSGAARAPEPKNPHSIGFRGSPRSLGGGEQLA